MTDSEHSNRQTLVRIEDIRQVCVVLLDELANRYGSEIVLSGASFEEDHYWDLRLDAAFQLVDQPSLYIVAGQTSDDVAELRKVLDGHSSSAEIVLGHDLGHLAAVLRRIASLDNP